MKIFIICSCLTICFITLSFLNFSHSSPLHPIFDPPGVNVPRNLRSMQQSKRNSFFNLKGIHDLRASGSGQFSEKTFKEMLTSLPVLPQHLLVIDLRQESHGFINGIPISWSDGIHNYGNLHKTKSEIESDESQRLNWAAQAKQIIVNPTQHPTKMTVYTAMTEQALVTSLGVSYLRLPVTDHNRPSNDIIDQFVELVKHLPPEQWLHLHCRAGKGRTTTFLTLLDMMKNAHQASLDEIIDRQKLCGGTHLKDFPHKVGEMKRAATERLNFIQHFYTYCQQVPDFQISWSNWLNKEDN